MPTGIYCYAHDVFVPQPDSKSLLPYIFVTLCKNTRDFRFCFYLKHFPDMAKQMPAGSVTCLVHYLS